VLSIGKPTVIVIVNGGMIAIDNLMNAPAIIEAFYPAMRGGEAIAKSIFGLENRWGKLPVTIYGANYINEVDMYSFDMTKSPGRTYRYYTDKPLFKFGEGLSYASFNITCFKLDIPQIECIVKNVGQINGDEVLMAYHRVSDDIKKKVSHPVPLKSLVDFARASVEKDKY